MESERRQSKASRKAWSITWAGWMEVTSFEAVLPCRNLPFFQAASFKVYRHFLSSSLILNGLYYKSCQHLQTAFPMSSLMQIALLLCWFLLTTVGGICNFDACPTISPKNLCPLERSLRFMSEEECEVRAALSSSIAGPPKRYGGKSVDVVVLQIVQ